MPYGSGSPSPFKLKKPGFVPPGLAKPKNKKAAKKANFREGLQRRLSNRNTSPGTPQGPIRSAGLPGNPGNSTAPGPTGVTPPGLAKKKV